MDLFLYPRLSVPFITGMIRLAARTSDVLRGACEILMHSNHFAEVTASFMYRHFQVLTVFAAGLLTGSFVAGTGSAQISIKMPNKAQKQGGLSGNWKLTRVDLSSGDTLTPGMQVWLKNTHLVFEGETSGRMISDQSVTLQDPGKAAVTCQDKTTSLFTVVRLNNHNFLRLGPGSNVHGKDCGQYTGDSSVAAGQNFMFDISRDSLTTFSYGGGDGTLIFTYVRAKPGFINFKK